MRRARVGILVAAGLAVRLVAATPAGAATITIVNNDAAGEGFNDPTPVAAVGGNPCGTLGAQRLRAMQFAADLWADRLASNVEIEVGATFDPLNCTGSSAVLGMAGPATVRRDFAGAPVASTWYSIAQANALNGTDLDAGDVDIDAFFNSDIDNNCFSSFTFYYGLDANPGGNQIDFVAVALHELGHGLGFLTLVNLATGAKAVGFDDVYMRELEDHSTTKLWPAMTDGERAASAVDTGDLHWVGPAVVAAGAGLTGGRDAISGHVQMYAPGTLQGGSSVNHWDTAVTPNEIMEPSYTTAIHDPGLAFEAMVDMGWPTVAPDCGDGVVQATEGCDDSNTADGDGCSHRCAIEQCYTCAGGPSVCTPVADGTGCDDGDGCTQTDTCQSGVCTGANPATCSSGDPCVAAGVCDSCTGDCSTGLPTCIDHFLCYKGKVSAGATKLTPITGVSLVDAFESLTVNLTKTRHLCTPADKNGEGTVDAATHLKDYQFKPLSGSPKHIPQTNLQIVNQLGTILLNTVKPALLLVPAAKDPNVDPTPPVFGSHEVDHYKCYKVKTAIGAPKFVPVQVSVEDQFTSPAKLFDLKKVAYLCTPVDKDGSSIKHSAVHQVCYKAKPASGQLKHTPQLALHLADQFGQERYDTKKEDILCVPSLVNP